MNVQIYSPVYGWIVPLEDVPDPVFAEKMVGNGLAIEPSSKVVLAPCDGVVVSLHDAHHACTIRHASGVDILIHIGIDTVNFKGDGFIPKIEEGSIVSKGQPLIEFDLDLIKEKAPSHLIIVIAVDFDEKGVQNFAQGEVSSGDRIYDVIT